LIYHISDVAMDFDEPRLRSCAAIEKRQHLPEFAIRVSINRKHCPNASCAAHLSALQTKFAHIERLLRADFSA
jgi:hypothetical protein